MVYKKNDISNQPVKHLIKMFCDPQGPVPNDAAPSEYLGRVKAVINDGKSLRGHDHFTHVGFYLPPQCRGVCGSADLSERRTKVQGNYRQSNLIAQNNERTY